MRYAKLFRDPIHDVIAYDQGTPFGRLMMQLIDTPSFQRLRHIRQLGLAFLVYHGAEHTRFSHSMGVAHLARKIFESIHRGESFESQRLIATCSAALLHDVGHAPFSHALESTLQEVLGFQGDHETFTRRILLWPDGDIFRILSDVDPTLPQLVANYISHEEVHYTVPIVSSQLDADRMDYLLRDGYMTGVQNHHYDADRILKLISHDHQGLVVHRRALQAVESYLLSRLHMYQQVYFHKTLRSCEGVVRSIFRRVLALLREGGHRELIPPGPFGRMLNAALRNDDVDIADYVRITESHAWVAFQQWSEHDDPILSDLCKRLEARRIYKSVEIPERELERFREHTLPELDEISRQAGFDPTYYTFLDQAIDLPFKPYDMEAMQAAEAIRIDMGGYIRPIEEVSPLIGALATIRTRVFRYCFPAPVRRAVKSVVSLHHPRS